MGSICTPAKGKTEIEKLSEMHVVLETEDRMSTSIEEPAIVYRIRRNGKGKQAGLRTAATIVNKKPPKIQEQGNEK